MNIVYIAAFVAVIGLVIGGYAFFNSSPENPNAGGAAATSTLANITTSEPVYYKNVEGYLAVPDDKDSHSGIILIHEWWGLNDDIKSIANRFAREGYVALAVDLYNGKSAANATSARELATGVRNNVEEAFANLRAAVSFLQARSGVDKERLASVGWCFGGGWSYQMAKNDLGVGASIMYYGQFDPQDDFEHMKADILGHFGEKDASISVNNVREFQAKLTTATGMHEIYIYPNAGHGFANSRGGTNAAYSEEAAELAWERTRAFLRKVFEE